MVNCSNVACHWSGTAEYVQAKYLVTVINEIMPNNYMLDSNVLFIC